MNTSELSEIRTWLVAKDQRIAELGAELADLRQSRDEAEESARLWREQSMTLRTELADLRASSVVYKVRCETCGGSGQCPCVDCGGPNHAPNKDCDGGCCVDCDNGWRLAEEVRVNMIEYLMDHGMGAYPSDVIAGLVDGLMARLIEGDTDE